MEEIRDKSLLEGISQGFSQGISQGISQGREEQTKEIVFNMVKQGLPAERIAMFVGQSVPTIESWIKETGSSAER